jgi:hypothetical protein
MKKIQSILFALLILVTIQACNKDEEEESVALGGDQSPMGNVGTTVSSGDSWVPGVTSCSAIVTALQEGVSVYSGSGVVTNDAIKNVLSNYPQFIIKGDTVSVKDVKIKSTTEGIESVYGLLPGIIVKYSSGVGDTYPIGSTGDVRTVVSKSTTDDYSYGFFLIKVMKIEEKATALKNAGISKITYWANHRFGLVGIEFAFDDGSNAKFPIYCSEEN